MKMTAGFVNKKLALYGLDVDHVTVRNGVYTATKQITQNSSTAKDLADEIIRRCGCWFEVKTWGTESGPRGFDIVNVMFVLKPFVRPAQISLSL